MGCRVRTPATRTTWGPRATDAWYIGPALDHYRCNRFYIPATKGYRISGTFELYPTHCCLPTLTPVQHTTTVFDEFIRAITNLPRATKSALLPTLLEAIHGVATSDAPAELPVHSTPDPTLAPTEGAPTSTDQHQAPTGNQPATTVIQHARRYEPCHARTCEPRDTTPQDKP